MLILFLTETYEINISHVRMLKTTTATRPRTFATESVDCSRLQTRRISQFPKQNDRCMVPATGVLDLHRTPAVWLDLNTVV